MATAVRFLPFLRVYRKKEKMEDLEIYNWIEEKSKIMGVSAFIKTVLKEAMDKEKESK